MKLTHLHLVPRLRIRAPIPLLLLYAFMTKTGEKKLSFNLLLTLAEHKHSEDSTQATAQRDLIQCTV